MKVLGQAATVLPLEETLGTPAVSQAVGAPRESACWLIRTQQLLMS